MARSGPRRERKFDPVKDELRGRKHLLKLIGECVAFMNFQIDYYYKEVDNRKEYLELLENNRAQLQGVVEKLITFKFTYSTD